MSRCSVTTKLSPILPACFSARSSTRTRSRESPTWAPSPVTLGARSMASCVARLSCAGSAPMRSMMTEMLRSPLVSSAESRWMGSTAPASASPAMPMAACSASLDVIASLSILMRITSLACGSPGLAQGRGCVGFGAGWQAIQPRRHPGLVVGRRTMPPYGAASVLSWLLFPLLSFSIHKSKSLYIRFSVIGARI